MQLLVKFKPGASKENKGRALGRGKALEKKMVWAGTAAGSNGGALVLVKLTDNKSKRVGMKAAAADIKLGECMNVQAKMLASRSCPSIGSSSSTAAGSSSSSR
jgi:hypothetical protein